MKSDQRATTILDTITVRETYYGYRPHGVRRMSASLHVHLDTRLKEKTTPQQERDAADMLRRGIATTVYGEIEEITAQLLLIAKRNANVGDAEILQEIENRIKAITRPCPTPKTTAPS